MSGKVTKQTKSTKRLYTSSKKPAKSTITLPQVEDQQKGKNSNK